MKCIILVGGYATRMYPLTVDKPKALLEINGITVLDQILSNLINSNDLIDEYFLVTNNTFHKEFNDWKQKSKYQLKITVVSDGSNSQNDKVGAASAVIKIINNLNIDDDVLVMAGDNILDFSLDYIFQEFKNNDYSYIMFYKELDIKKLTKTGLIELNHDRYVLSFEEKPKVPKTNYAVPPFYWLKKEDIKKLLDLWQEKYKSDSLGSIIFTLCNHTKIRAILMRGKRYDVGSLNEYLNITNRS